MSDLSPKNDWRERLAIAHVDEHGEGCYCAVRDFGSRLDLSVSELLAEVKRLREENKNLRNAIELNVSNIRDRVAERDAARAEVERLRRELDAERCEDCGAELSACGPMTEDGPEMTCRACDLQVEVKRLREEVAALKGVVNAGSEIVDAVIDSGMGDDDPFDSLIDVWNRRAGVAKEHGND